MTEADLDAVLAIAAALPTSPQWQRSAYAAAMDAAAIPCRIALVAEANQSVAGFAVASMVAGEGEIESIAVRAGEQRQGIGMALLTELLQELAVVGATAVVLELRQSNRAAAGLYARAGFTETGRRPGYYRDPVEDAILLRLEIQKSDELSSKRGFPNRHPS
jgi:ribosomal-protein-alanine N-acetyltransferase